MATTVYAGVELVRLEVTPLADRVQIEWETAREYDVAAFQLFFKQETEPDAAYQRIGEPIPAQGELESGAVYVAEFFQLEPNVSYCFRLQELTNNNEPGEIFERCGYGLGLSPTATFTTTPTVTPIPTATPIPTSTPFPAQGPTSPLPTPIPVSPQPNGTSEGGVIVVLTPPAQSGEDPVAETPFFEPTYIVLTATPTETPFLIPPTPTPLPLATPTTALSMLGLDRWFGTGAATSSLSNLIVLMLCVGGIGLALIGVMTLLGTIFYLRSRL
jgi:hypothetical protein